MTAQPLSSRAPVSAVQSPDDDRSQGEALLATSVAMLEEAARRPLQVMYGHSWHLASGALQRMPRAPHPIRRSALLDLLAGVGAFDVQQHEWVVRQPVEAFRELYPEGRALQVELFKAFGTITRPAPARRRLDVHAATEPLC